jgi:protein-L-isoaspartate(D-aspartate) O-methyltransferase
MHIQEQKLAQQSTGKGRNIHNQQIVDIMMTIPRHWFVPTEIRHRAYDDCALPIGYDQTISQPYMVALMTEILDPQPDQRILEIGAGSGYQTAIISRLAKEIFALECVRPLLWRASEALSRLGCENVHLKEGNGHLGWPDEAPFDSILIACAPKEIPWQLTEQLKPEGHMIVPVGEKHKQKLVRVFRKDKQWVNEAILDVRFVPMVDVRSSA